MKLSGSMLIMLLLLGCGSRNDTPSSPSSSSKWITPNGHRVNMSMIGTLYTRDWIDTTTPDIKTLEHLDWQIEICRMKYGGGNTNYTYEIFNDYAFRCESSTGLCAGWTDRHTIKATIYTKTKSETYPTWQTNPNLLRTKEQMKQWTGVNGWITQGSNYYSSDLFWYGEQGWKGLEVICHELEHCWRKVPDKASIEIHYTQIEF